jgi:hypothetical protein
MSKLRLVMDIAGVTADQLLAAGPLFRVTAAGGFDVAAEPVALGDPEEMDRTADVERAVAIRALGDDAAMPDGEDPLNWLKMCIQGYDYLLMDDGGPDHATWREARDRGKRRIVAACLVAAAQLRAAHA